MRRWGWFTIVLAASCALATGCTSVTGGQASLPTKAPKSKPDHRDRDRATVLPQLAKLDACALVPAKTITHRRVKATPQGPYSCSLRPKGKDIPELKITVGTQSDHMGLARGEPRTIGGARAYQQDMDPSFLTYGESACEIAVPTSFETSVDFKLETAKRDSCAPLTAQIAAAIPRINATNGSPKLAKRPGFGWIGCTVLGKSLGAERERHRIRAGSTFAFNLSGCHVDNPPVKPITPEFSLRYDLWRPEHKIRIAGKVADQHKDGDVCTVAVKLGNSGVSDGVHEKVLASVDSGSCRQSQSIATKATRTLSDPPPKMDFKPLPRLTYKANEPVQATRGACVNLIGSAKGCTPASPVAVPDKIHEALRTADGNNNVTCSTFGDAVTKAFGSRYQPINQGKHCFFVSKRHPVQIQADLDRKHAATDYAVHSKNHSEPNSLTIAGHPGFEFIDKEDDSYHISVAPGHDPHKQGNVHIKVDAQTPRGKPIPAETEKPTDAQTAAAKQAITETVERFD